MSDVRQFVADLRTTAQAHVDKRTAQLSKGQCPNFESYHGIVGEIRGIQALISAAFELLGKQETDDDGKLPDMPNE